MDSSTVLIAFMGLPGGMEWVLILLLGLLLFGRRLPEVGRSLGQSVVEFRKGIKGIEDEIDESAERPRSVSAGSSPKAPLPKSSETAAEPVAQGDPVDERRVSKADEVE